MHWSYVSFALSHQNVLEPNLKVLGHQLHNAGYISCTSFLANFSGYHDFKLPFRDLTT